MLKNGNKGKNKKTWKLSIDAFQSIALARGETCKEKIKNFKIFVDNIKNSNIYATGILKRRRKTMAQGKKIWKWKLSKLGRRYEIA